MDFPVGMKALFTITAEDGLPVDAGSVVCQVPDSTVVSVVPADAGSPPNSFWVIGMGQGAVTLVFSAPGCNPKSITQGITAPIVLRNLVITVGTPVPA